MRRPIAFAVAVLLCAVASARAAQLPPVTNGQPGSADKVQRVLSPKGLEVWLVEDHRLPILSLAFAFRGGMALDPKDKPGVAHFVSGVLDEGAGPRDSRAFQTALADNAISLSFYAGRDEVSGQVRTLTTHRDLAAELLHDALTAPHIEAKDVDRVRDQILAQIKRNMADPEWLAQRNFNNTVFAGHPYGQPGYGTLETVPTITPDDLKGFVAAHFGRDQLVVTATGDIDAATLGQLVDRVFGDLPAQAAAFTVPDIVPQGLGKTYVVDKPVAESVLLLGAPGVKRDDPDWFAAEAMNYILGGGGFNSRLMEEVRAKAALTYGISSTLVPFEHSALLIINGSTRDEDAGKALALVRQELARLAGGSVTDAELNDAMVDLTGSIPLRMTSTMGVAQMLLQLRLGHRPIDFLDTFAAHMDAVTKADVARVARRLLPPEDFAQLVLGHPTDVTATGNVVP